MVSQTGQLIIKIHILPDISRTRVNQAMKFSQIMKYSVRNVFLKSSCRKWGRENSSRPLFAF